MIIDEVKKKMREKGITPYKLSLITKIQQSTLSYIFTKGVSPRLDTLEKICDALDLKIKIVPNDDED